MVGSRERDSHKSPRALLQPLPAQEAMTTLRSFGETLCVLSVRLHREFDSNQMSVQRAGTSAWDASFFYMKLMGQLQLAGLTLGSRLVLRVRRTADHVPTIQTRVRLLLSTGRFHLPL